MPPKLDPNAQIELCFTIRGGYPNPSALAPKVGPLGLSPKKVAEDIEKVTKEFEFLKVPVKLKIKGRDYTVEVVPTVSNLIIRALPDMRTDRNCRHFGDVSLKDLIQIARIVRPRSLAATFRGTLKEVIGSAKAVVGITVNGGMDALDLLKAIESGDIEVPNE